MPASGNFSPAMRASPLLLCLLLAACGGSGDTITPETGPITEAIYASGIVKAADQYNVFASATGILTQVLVHKGDSVKAGQPLFLIDDRASALATRNAELALELSERNATERSPVLKERTLAVQLAHDKLVNDSLLFLRQQNLWAQQIGSRNEFEQRELAFHTSQTNYANAVAALEDTRTRLANDLAMARNNAARSAVAQGDLTVRSLVDGRVFDILLDEGELVSPQIALGVVGRADAFIVELQVDEQDIARVRTGQDVLLSMDSYDGQVLKASITRIHPIMDPRSRTFTVEARFTQPPPALYPYLTAEANIVVAHKDHALTVPADHVIDGRYVLTGKDQRTEVRTGLHDLQRVEIVSGIDSTTHLYRP